MVIDDREELSKESAPNIVTSDEQQTSDGSLRLERRATSNQRRATSRVAFHTLGCKVNQFDTNGLIAKFREQGYEIVDFKEPAEIYVINTCTVTKTAEQKARQLIRKVKRDHPEAMVVVTGCYAQTKAEALARMSEIDLLVGVAGRSNLVKLIEQESSLWEKNKVIPWESVSQFEVFTPEYNGKTRAFLKIEDGCESYCSYCKIPFARGPVRSLPSEQVKAEIRRMLALGYKEIVLVGIHLGEYGKDLDTDLASLLMEIERECGEDKKGEWRLRLGSIEPRDFSPLLMEVLHSSQLICNHLHIPLQSGSGTVLSRMNRRYSPDDYAGLVSMLRKGIPRLALTTDVMVGFPGETKEEFTETLNFIKAIGFSRIHIFPYSMREGTKAARMNGHLFRKTKEERVRHLEVVAEELAKEYRLKFLGEIVEVLLEEKNPQGYWEGFSREYLRIQVKGDWQANTLLQVLVTTQETEVLTGKVVKTGDI